MSKRYAGVGAKIRLPKIVLALKDREYKFGGNGEIVGDPFDCFGMLVEYYKLKSDIDILEQHKGKGYDFFSYHKLPDEIVMETFANYLSNLFLPVVVSYRLPGDILKCKYNDMNTIGIFLGNGNMLITSPKTNCIVISTSYYEIEGAYRWPLLSQ